MDQSARKGFRQLISGGLIGLSDEELEMLKKAIFRVEVQRKKFEVPDKPILLQKIKLSGNLKIARYVKAFRRGQSVSGLSYSKGQPIIHCTSTRSTGQSYYLLPTEVEALLQLEPIEWVSKWSHY